MISYTFRIWDESHTLDGVMSSLVGTPLMPSLIKEIGLHLILQKNIADYKILETVDEALQKSMLSDFCRHERISGEKALTEWLARNHKTLDLLLSALIHAERVERLKKLHISDEAVKALFLERKPRLDEVTFGLIRLNSEAVAKEIYHRIQDDGQDFATLAQRFSTGAEAKNGGLVGPRLLHELNAELRSCLLSLKPNEVTEPFSIDGKSYFIARLIRRDSAQLTPERVQSLRDELFEKWCDQQIKLAGVQFIQNQEPGAKTTAKPASKKSKTTDKQANKEAIAL